MARGQITRVHLPIPGGFTIYNALCALSVGLCLGLRLSECAAALRSARTVLHIGHSSYFLGTVKDYLASPQGRRFREVEE